MATNGTMKENSLRHKLTWFDVHHLLYLQLLGEVVGDNGSEGGEQGSQEDTNVTDVNRDVEKM